MTLYCSVISSKGSKKNAREEADKLREDNFRTPRIPLPVNNVDEHPVRPSCAKGSTGRTHESLSIPLHLEEYLILFPFTPKMLNGLKI